MTLIENGARAVCIACTAAGLALPEVVEPLTDAQRRIASAIARACVKAAVKEMQAEKKTEPAK